MKFDPNEYVHHTHEAAKFLTNVFSLELAGFTPQVVLTLGSGLDGLRELIDAECVMSYGDIPHFPMTSVVGHRGELIAGYIGNVPVFALAGRLHYYEVAQEPYGIMNVVFPVHVMANLGVSLYMATNAAGGLNGRYEVGDLMIIRDHIGLFMPNPLTGPHLDFDANPYFQPQNDEYDVILRQLFSNAVHLMGESRHVHEGVYAAVSGRTYETAAESRFLRMAGVDAVGMSTVPEVIAATNRGMKTLGVSIIANCVAPDGTNATSHEEVESVLCGADVKTRLTKVFLKFFSLYREMIAHQ